MSEPVCLENETLSVAVDPDHGGRIVRFSDRRFGFEHAWYDASRLPVNPALDYDGNFAGGFDELLPNDVPERGFPDHGELWTLPLNVRKDGMRIVLEGALPVCGLMYSRTMSLSGSTLISEYEITNPGEREVAFLWKLHASLRIDPGDLVFAPAECCQAPDPGDWSKFPDAMPRAWRNPYTVPEMNGSSDFLFLTGLSAGELSLQHTCGRSFRCQFDPEIFRCAWLFFSFGRLNASRTAILEPCTNYPLSLDDAERGRVCAKLKPGQTIATAVRWTAD